MRDAVIDHVLKNIWCTPDQDNQYIFKPARISRPRGVRHYQTVEWETIYLPDREHTWHLFQIGQLSPLYLNLLPDDGRWYCVESMCVNNNLLVNAYVNSGVQFPRRLVFFKKTRTRNVLVAIKDVPQLPSLEKEALYLRFYTNAFFQSTRSTVDEHHVKVKGIQVERRSDVVVFQREIRDLQVLPGHVSVFHNGWLVNDTHPSLVANDDYIEYVYDSAVYDVVDFPIETLPVFHSTLDQQPKYALSRLKGTANQIDFHDDVDVYLLRPDEERFEGVYYHRNQPYAVRQLTHKDYAIPSQRVVAFANDHEEWGDPRELTIRLKVRRSGYQRPLVFEANRIHELYRLDNPAILQAIQGINSTVSVWRAPALEHSGYVTAMGKQRESITLKTAQDALGYHAITKLVADTPIQVSGDNSYPIPVGLQQDATFFEYDGHGHLLEWRYLSQTAGTYTPNNPNTRLVEMLMGLGSQRLDTIYQADEVTLAPGFNYRFYVSTAIGGISSEDWQEAVEGTDYVLSGNKVVWSTDPIRQANATRSDRQFLLYDFSLPFTRGYLRFNIETIEVDKDEEVIGGLTIPLGSLDVFLNGYSLIENLDYYVHGTQVVVVNKAFLTDEGPQHIVVRAGGFCQPDMAREKPAEVGFITHGLLSRNRRYNVRDDKVMRMVVSGGLQHTNNLLFSEHDSGLRIENIRNGAPYQLSDIVVPLRGLDDIDPYRFREESLQVDREIEDYLTVYYPEPEIPGPSIIPHRHLVYSPFLSAVHEDLLYGVLVIEEKRQHYSDMDIRRWLEAYEWLLDYDPIINNVDERYVLVQAHRFIGISSLNVYQYTFLGRVAELYFKGRIDLSHAIEVS